MTCHSCTHSDAIQRGDYDSMPWDELPCSSCKLAEDTFHSIPFDEAHPPSICNRQPAVDNRQCTMLPAEVLSDFVNGLLSLPLELRDVVSLRFQGLPYKEIALRQGTTIQCAEMRHKRAMKIWPALEALFPYKTAKRKRRRLSTR